MIIHFAELFAHAGARKRMCVFAPGSYSKAKPRLVGRQDPRLMLRSQQLNSSQIKAVNFPRISELLVGSRLA